MNPFKSFTKYKLQDWIFTIFSIFWISIIILDYLNKQVIYIPSIRYFKYFGLFTFLGLLGSVLSLWYNKKLFFKKARNLPLNGLLVFVLFIVIVWSVTFAYNQYWKAPLDYTNYLHLFGKGIFTLGCSYLIVLANYSIGNLFRSKVFESPSKSNFTFILLDIALGFVIYTFILMILGSLKLLDQIIVLGIISLMLLANYKNTLNFVLLTLWKPIPRAKDFNFWGGLIAFFVLVYITLNYFYTQAPFPLGFDARNYYVNISRLIADAGGLIPGFQPYAWGLVMSTGYIAFNSPEITLFISILGGLLSLFAIHHFCSKFLGISSNFSWLVVLLYLLTPTVTNHFIIEFKVDLALVFFQMTIVLFLLWWLFDLKKRSSKRISFVLSDRSDYKAIVLLGILLGYCLSIKVLSVFLIFGIFLGLWWYNEDLFGVIGISALGVGFILISGFDSLSGMRDYHKSPTTSGIILASFGVLCLTYSFFKSRSQFMNSLKTVVICGAIALMTFTPWIYKNYTYTKSLSLTKLLMGEKPRPDIDVRSVIQNYREAQKSTE